MKKIVIIFVVIVIFTISIVFFILLKQRSTSGLFICPLWTKVENICTQSYPENCWMVCSDGSNKVFLNVKSTSSATDVRPPVVDFFACGDNCPGPAEKYTVKVYKGVTDSKECEKIGGKPSSFVGWGTTYFCLAQ